MILEIIIMLVMFWGTVFWGIALRDITIPGLLSGKVQARGRHYTRADQPIRFWFCIVSFILVFLMMLFISAGYVLKGWTLLQGL